MPDMKRDFALGEKERKTPFLFPRLFSTGASVFESPSVSSLAGREPPLDRSCLISVL